MTTPSAPPRSATPDTRTTAQRWAERASAAAGYVVNRYTGTVAAAVAAVGIYGAFQPDHNLGWQKDGIDYASEPDAESPERLKSIGQIKGISAFYKDCTEGEQTEGCADNTSVYRGQRAIINANLARNNDAKAALSITCEEGSPTGESMWVIAPNRTTVAPTPDTEALNSIQTGPVAFTEHGNGVSMDRNAKQVCKEEFDAAAKSGDVPSGETQHTFYVPNEGRNPWSRAVSSTAFWY
jgi:hypothetical protein